MKLWIALMALSSSAFAGSLIQQPAQSPLVTIRVVFRTGAASDPKGKEGLAEMTAAMISEAGSKKNTTQKITEKLFPMAVSIDSGVDKEMTTFVAETHTDNLDAFYEIFKEVLFTPGWRAEDLKRLKDDQINSIQVALRGNNDEELGKEVLYQELYKGHPYQHLNLGKVSAIKSLTLDDIKTFYRDNYTQANLTIAIAGGYPATFPARIEKDFEKLPKGTPSKLSLPAPAKQSGRHFVLVEKQTRSVAMSLGFPIEVRRGHPDFVALLVAQSWFGQHRTSGVRLYDRLREKRGLNYGDYAYIEYFPRGMYQFEPDANLARQQQIFQMWIRPVQPPTAHFTLRLAMFELERLVREGLTEEEFQRTRNFLSKYVNLLTRTKRAELGYAIDSAYYETPDYNSYVKTGLAKLTRDDVNKAVRKHLTADNLTIVVVGENLQQFRDAVVGEKPSAMAYNSPKPQDILDEDKLVEKLPLRIPAANVKTLKSDELFE